NELWLRLDGPAAPVVDRLRDRGDVAELADRGVLARAAVSDPFARALAANLALGFLAAGLLSVGAFALHFFVLARGRAADYAVLRANGLSSAELGGELLVAEGVVLAVGLPLGTLVGALLALTLLPLLTTLGTSRVGPPAALAVASLPVGAGLVLLLAASALAGWLAGGLGARVRVADELRSLA
ncbi:MAG TPA: hypothetical protein VKF59_20985, partial [Candidatus Dormibacteraeota bacterium]|nr:hypothetical protein [Candidatus Dormibacteraeota bacterium]